MFGDPTTRRERILKAAFDAFAAYGFRRTSMDDIARAAGVSRPALYQSFANKIDIFTAISTAFGTDVDVKVRDIVSGDGPMEDKLSAIFDVSVLAPHRTMENTPHGEELLGLKDELVAGLFEEWRNNRHRAILEVLQAGGELETSLARDLAALLDQSTQGMKTEGQKTPALQEMFDAWLRIVRSART